MLTGHCIQQFFITVHPTIVEPWRKVKAAVLSYHKPEIIPRDLFSTDHKTVQSSGGGQLFCNCTETSDAKRWSRLKMLSGQPTAVTKCLVKSTLYQDLMLKYKDNLQI
jgi:hypothetical protein